MALYRVIYFRSSPTAWRRHAEDDDIITRSQHSFCNTSPRRGRPPFIFIAQSSTRERFEVKDMPLSRAPAFLYYGLPESDYGGELPLLGRRSH